MIQTVVRTLRSFISYVWFWKKGVPPFLNISKQIKSTHHANIIALQWNRITQLSPFILTIHISAQVHKYTSLTLVKLLCVVR